MARNTNWSKLWGGGEKQEWREAPTLTIGMIEEGRSLASTRASLDDTQGVSATSEAGKFVGGGLEKATPAGTEEDLRFDPAKKPTKFMLYFKSPQKKKNCLPSRVLGE